MMDVFMAFIPFFFLVVFIGIITSIKFRVVTRERDEARSLAEHRDYKWKEAMQATRPQPRITSIHANGDVTWTETQ